MKKDIIFYSNFCTYSKEIINQISKTPLNDKMLYVCVDDENIQLPNFVTAVPTVYLVEKKRIVVDESIPKWIQEQVSQKQEKKTEEIQAYFGSTDSSFGASFSSLDNNDKPFVSSTFTFIGEEQQITTPNDSSGNSGNSGNSNPMNTRSNSAMDNDFERLQNQRNSEFQTVQRR